MDFEFKLSFLSKFESKRGWILRDFVFTNANSLGYKRGQGVHHTDLQTLLFYLGDMHRPSPNIKEVIEFPKRLSVKENLEIS
jgi:hypothetical protein